MAFYQLKGTVSSTGMAMLAVLSISSGAARADVLVLESTVPGVQRGEQLPDARKLDIKVNQMLKVLRPAGQTQTIAGPDSRTVGDIVKGEKLNEVVWNRFKTQLSGNGSSTGITGMTRGISK